MTTRTLAEQETIYRWDRAERVLWGWTANRAERTRWAALGYPIMADGGGWHTRVPVEALALLPLTRGMVQVSRYLAPPVVLVAVSTGDRPANTRISEETELPTGAAPKTPAPEGMGA